MPNKYLMTTSWAVTPQMLEVIDGVITSKLMGQDLDIAKIEADIGRPLDNKRTEKPYQVEDGVAVISMVGLVGKRMNLFTQISGGVSTEVMQSAIQTAIDDPEVDALVLDIDSPGGTVDGSFELADTIRQARAQKPVFAYANGLMASAAYLFGASADQIYAYRSASLGSVSIVVCHYDQSKADAKAGIKRTFVTSGKYKRMANDAEPLSVEGQEYLQDSVDRYHALFIEGIAAGRDMTPEQVDSTMGDGRVLLAGQALELNMIDAIGSLADTINAARAAAKETHMNKEELQKKYPEASAALIEEGKAEALAGVGSTMDETHKKEMAVTTGRIFGLYTKLHGADAGANFQKLADSGLTAEQMDALAACGFGATAAAVIDPASTVELEKKQQILTALEKTGQHNVQSAGKDVGPVDFMTVVDAHVEASAGKISKAKAIQAMAKEYPKLHAAYLEQANKR